MSSNVGNQEGVSGGDWVSAPLRDVTGLLLMLGGIQDSPSVFGETETSPRRERFTLHACPLSCENGPIARFGLSDA